MCVRADNVLFAFISAEAVRPVERSVMLVHKTTCCICFDFNTLLMSSGPDSIHPSDVSAIKEILS